MEVRDEGTVIGEEVLRRALVIEMPLFIEALALHLQAAVLLSVIKVCWKMFVEPGRLSSLDSVFQLSLFAVTDALLHSLIPRNVLSRIETLEVC